jgi:pyruvate dehydrogenase E2 component (dihydrolipoamide acetyltransferase)
MAKKVIMPKQGLQMTEGTITSWLVRENGQVVKDEPLFEMETDKLTITIDAPESGTLLKILQGEGETVPITETIAIIGEAGEDYSDLLNEQPASKNSQTDASAQRQTEKSAAAPESVSEVFPEAAPSEPSAQSETAAPSEHTARIFITPRARTLAQQKSIDYSKITGSGPDGLIIEKDVMQRCEQKIRATPLARKVAGSCNIELDTIKGTGTQGKITRSDVARAAAQRSEQNGQADTPLETRVPFSPMRRIIAQRMLESQRTAAQAAHRVRVDMTEAANLREAFKGEGKKISYNDIAALAVCRALTEFPIMNSEVRDDSIIMKHYVNLGIAVALEDGLVVPVIRNAHRMSIEEIGAATRQLAEKAKSRLLQPEDYSGGSFTISNLGMYGLDSFTAVLNPPESGILAIGRVADTAVVNASREVEVRLTAELTLTYDHRVVDGAPAASFLMRIRQYMEQPYLML